MTAKEFFDSDEFDPSDLFNSMQEALVIVDDPKLQALACDYIKAYDAIFKYAEKVEEGE